MVLFKLLDSKEAVLLENKCLWLKYPLWFRKRLKTSIHTHRKQQKATRSNAMRSRNPG